MSRIARVNTWAIAGLGLLGLAYALMGGDLLAPPFSRWLAPAIGVVGITCLGRGAVLAGQKD